MNAGPAQSLRNFHLSSGESGNGAPIADRRGLLRSGRSDHHPDARPATRSDRLVPPDGRRPTGRRPTSSQRNIALDGNADGRGGDNFIGVFVAGVLQNSRTTSGTASAAVTAAAVDSIFTRGGLRVVRN